MPKTWSFAAKNAQVKFQLASDQSVCANGAGKIIFFVNEREVTLCDVLYVPLLRGNFISVSKVTMYNNFVEFNSPTKCKQ